MNKQDYKNLTIIEFSAMGLKVRWDLIKQFDCVPTAVQNERDLIERKALEYDMKFWEIPTYKVKVG